MSNAPKTSATEPLTASTETSQQERSRRWLLKASLNLSAVSAVVLAIPKKSDAAPKTVCSPFLCGPGYCQPLSCPPIVNP